MFCPNCGNEVANGSAFCRKCGASVAQPPAGAPGAPGEHKGPQASAVITAPDAATAVPSAQTPKKKKGGKGKAILALFVVLVLAGGGFLAYSMLGDSDDAPVSEPGPIDTNFWIGKWSGGLVSTETTRSSPKCYGGEAQEMTLDITKISDAGRVSMDVTLLYHGHDASRLTTDAQTVPGDSMETFSDVTATFDPAGFTATMPMADDEGEMKIEVRPAQGTDSGIEVIVTSKLGLSPSIIDTYLLHRQ